MKDIIVLSIETSCDETSVAIVKNGREIISNKIYSQIDIHNEFGGVVPEVASRKHLEVINIVIDEALKEGNINLNDIDVISATYGPGLIGALLVGLQYAKGLSYALNKDFIGVNHIEGHISSCFLEHKDLVPPFISLVVSGGHTMIFNVKDYGVYEKIGETRDDAIGEVFDKIARKLNLSYPGGPNIERLAKNGDEDKIKFPKSRFEEETLDFSYSGLKSSVLNYINTNNLKNIEINKEDVCASFQKTAVSMLIENVEKAFKLYGGDKLSIVGGVSSNNYLKERFKNHFKNVKVYTPSKILCTDNGAMIASAAYYSYLKNGGSEYSLNVSPNIKF